jgi:hypothetical protein
VRGAYHDNEKALEVVPASHHRVGGAGAYLELEIRFSAFSQFRFALASASEFKNTPAAVSSWRSSSGRPDSVALCSIDLCSTHW